MSPATENEEVFGAFLKISEDGAGSRDRAAKRNGARLSITVFAAGPRPNELGGRLAHGRPLDRRPINPLLQQQFSASKWAETLIACGGTKNWPETCRRFDVVATRNVDDSRTVHGDAEFHLNPGLSPKVSAKRVGGGAAYC